MRLILVLIALLGLTPASVAAAPDTTTSIAGGGLPFAVRLAAADADAFFRRLDPPPELEPPPGADGPVFEITSAYWDVALKSRDESRPQAEARARYYPSGGYAVARLAGKDVWLLLDLRQRAILDRYIRLESQGAIGPEPGVLGVVRAAARTEAVGIAVGPRELSADQARAFWAAAAPLELRRAPQSGAGLPAASATLTWIVFTLPEGRSVELTYDVAAGLLRDRFATETYQAPSRWLVTVLGPVADPGSPEYNLAPLQIAHAESPGSRLWWAVLLGGGFSCLAAALWLRRGLATRR